MKHLLITHTTTYRYAEPVIFGPHRMMLRPRDSHDLWLISATLTTSLPADLAWGYDIFGNVIATAHFTGQSDELTIESRLEIERFSPTVPTAFATGAETPYPFDYNADDILDLGACLANGTDEINPDIDAWIEDVRHRGSGTAAGLLTLLCEEIHATFTYETRFEETTRAPVETFRLRSGACRDFAALFIAVARRLGFGARFISGYLFDPPVEIGGITALQGAGATHAWAEVYLPDVGWIEFDPTNGLVASDRLIRIAGARAPHQAIPIKGSFTGSTGAFIGLWIGVTVESLDEQPAGSDLAGALQ